MSGPREPRHPRPDDKTVEVPLQPPRGTGSPTAEEPWWKNANSRVSPPPTPAPPPMPPPPPMPRAPQPQTRRPTQARNRHAKAASPRKRGQVVLLGVVGVVAIGLAVVLVMLVLSGLGGFTGKALDVAKAEAGVQRVLLDPEDGYSATTVSDVVCNDGKNPEIKKDASFTCEAVVDGRKRQVLVVFTDDKGTYEVDRPR